MLLETDNLTKYYGQRCALDRLNLTLAPGEIFGLLGPNGSGKSTAIRLILGLLRPTSGAARVQGHDCWHAGVNARRYLAYLPGELRLYENMTGWRLVQFLNGLRGGFDRAAAERLARDFDIDLGRPIAQLSSGMKRKVALVQVLSADTPLLILDEPTNTLDPTMRDALLEQLAVARRNGRTILFSSHVLSEVERVCDRVGILREGRLAHLQALTQLRQARRIRARLANPGASVPAFAGLQGREQHDGVLVLTVDGPLAPVLEWLARERVQDLTVEPAGLDAIYRQIHGPGE